jgi:hypothetical protein
VIVSLDGAAFRICLFIAVPSTFLKERRRGVCLTVPPSAGMNRIRFEGTRETLAISALFIQGAPGTLRVCPASARSQATKFGEGRFPIWR